jgi:hypothetical protein
MFQIANNGMDLSQRFPREPDHGAILLHGKACLALLLEHLMHFRVSRVAVESKANHLEPKSAFENCLEVEKPGYDLFISFSVEAWPGVNNTAG